MNKLEGISVRTSLDLDPQEGRWGREGNLSGRGGTQGSGCPLRARPAPRGAECLKGSAGGRPPTPARVARAGAGHNGPAGRADGPGPGCRKGKGNRERAEGEGGPEVPQVPPQPGPGARLQRRNAASPPQTQQRRKGNPGRARCGRLGREKKVAGSLLRATGRRHHGGGGVPVPTHAGKSRLPAAARARP